MTGYAEARNEDICSHFIRNYKRSKFYEQIQNSPFQNSSIGKIASPVPGDLDAATGSCSLRLKVNPARSPMDLLRVRTLLSRSLSALDPQELLEPTCPYRHSFPVVQVQL